ncbi:MAG: helix-turn-helix domain-containing protein [Prevotella intermedia]
MKTLITDEQKEEVKRLYRLQKHTIKQIMKLTGVRSEQTIYVILDEARIPRKVTRKIVKKITVGVDEELNEIIEKEKPKNIAEFVCNMAKEGYYATSKEEQQ